MAYATDLSDSQWRLVRDLFDPPGHRGRPARIPRRRMVNAVLYQARTGCQWRYLPRHFGPWGAVWQPFRRWRDAGVWEQALVRLPQARRRAGRDPEPSMVMLDSQTVKGGRGGPGFHEAGGKFGGTFGAKRTVLIDYLGLPVAARVDSARPHDSQAGRLLLDDSPPNLPRVGEVLADLGFEPLVKGIQRRHKVTVTIKGWRKPNKQAQGLQAHPAAVEGRGLLRPTRPVATAVPQLRGDPRLGHHLAPRRLRRLPHHQAVDDEGRRSVRALRRAERAPSGQSGRVGEEAREHDEARGTSARLVRDYIDVVINQRRVDRLDDYVAANYCGHGFHDDREALRSFLTWQASTAPDWHVTVEDVVAEGDRVAVRAIASGIRAERAPGQAHDEPTFRRVEWTTIYRVHSGRIAEAWVVSRDLDSPQPSGGSKAGRQAAAVAESNIAVVERMFEALERLAIEEVNACWSSDARWFILDHNEFGGDYSVADYLEMLGRFFEKYGHGYEFRINEARAHGDLVVLFCHSEQQQLGSTDGLMIYRLRDGLIAEGWTMSRGSDSGLPW